MGDDPSAGQQAYTGQLVDGNVLYHCLAISYKYQNLLVIFLMKTFTDHQSILYILLHYAYPPFILLFICLFLD